MKYLVVVLATGFGCLGLSGCDSSDESKLTIAPDISGATPKDNYSIVFQSLRDAPFASSDYQANHQRYFDLYVMNDDGFDVTWITDKLYWENQPDVSPDGRKILFGFNEFQDSTGPLEGTGPGWEIAVISNPDLRKSFRRVMAGIVPFVNTLGYTAALGPHWGKP